MVYARWRKAGPPHKAGLHQATAARCRPLGVTLTCLAFMLAACGGEPNQPDAPWVALGGGLESYIALNDGDEVELVLGQQGGWHIDLATRFVDMVPDGVVLTYRLWDVATEQQLAYPIKVYVTRDEVTEMADGSFTRSGDRVIMVGKPASVVGRSVRAELDAIVDGVLLQDDRAFVVIDEQP